VPLSQRLFLDKVTSISSFGIFPFVHGGKKCRGNKLSRLERAHHGLASLIAFFTEELGLPLQVYKLGEGYNKGFRFTSFSAKEGVRILVNIDRICDLFYPKEPGKKEFWVEFFDLYEQLTYGTDMDQQEFWLKTLPMAKLFNEEYSAKYFRIYFHMLMEHGWDLYQKLGPLVNFSSQGLERFHGIQKNQPSNETLATEEVPFGMHMVRTLQKGKHQKDPDESSDSDPIPKKTTVEKERIRRQRIEEKQQQEYSISDSSFAMVAQFQNEAVAGTQGNWEDEEWTLALDSLDSE
jgi:hypothetical protein